MVKILTWNVNGIRALKIPLKQQLDNLDADIICLQETKVTRDQLDEQTAIVDGYNSYFSFSKVKSGYSGVATFVRDVATPCRAEEGLTGLLWPASTPDSQRIGCYGQQAGEFSAEELTRLDNEGRCVMTEHCITYANGEERSLVVINVYCPRAEPGNSDRLKYKLSFYRLLQMRAEAILDAGSHIIILGDINTSHRKIDHCSPDDDEEFFANPGRHWMDGLLLPAASSEEAESAVATSEPCHRRFIDTYRWLHPTELNAFTNWCTLTGARATNYGCRLDYIIADVGLLPCLLASQILADIEGSDHCPVVTELNCRVITALRCPPVCTRHMPQFAGRQQKLAAFFTKRTADSQSQQPSIVTSVNNGIIGIADLTEDDKSIGHFAVSEDYMTTSHSSDETQAEVSKTDPILDPVKRIVQCPIQGLVPSNPEEEYNLQCFERCSGMYLNLNESPTVERASKRTASVAIAKQSKSKKSKGGGGDVDTARGSGTRQSNLLNFFNKPCIAIAATSTSTPPREDTKNVVELSGGAVLSTFSSASSKVDLTMATAKTVVPKAEADCKLTESTSASWKTLLKGPPVTPLCKGHNEPCVLRTVRKDGPNKGKQFWVCNRPEGHKTNPAARCDYFVWVSLKKQ